jgi:hypothetical protein
MKRKVELVKKVICREEMDVKYIRECNMLDNKEEDVIN